MHRMPAPRLQLSPPFESVVRTYERDLMRFSLHLSSNREDALELFQETWLRAYRAWPRIQRTENLKPWLFQIALNVERNNRRNFARRSKLTARPELPSSDGSTSESGLRLIRLRRTVNRLPTKQRQAFVMRQVDGMDYSEIGRILGCTAVSARANVSQALSKIKKELSL